MVGGQILTLVLIASTRFESLRDSRAGLDPQDGRISDQKSMSIIPFPGNLA